MTKSKKSKSKKLPQLKEFASDIGHSATVLGSITGLGVGVASRFYPAEQQELIPELPYNMGRFDFLVPVGSGILGLIVGFISKDVKTENFVYSFGASAIGMGVINLATNLGALSLKRKKLLAQQNLNRLNQRNLELRKKNEYRQRMIEEKAVDPFLRTNATISWA